MEPLITISLSDYKNLKDIETNFQKAFDGNKTVVFHDSFFSGPSGYPVHRFTVVSNDEFAKDLLKKIERIERENASLTNEFEKLKEKLNKKNSWF